jgi:hypothetical protein
MTEPARQAIKPMPRIAASPLPVAKAATNNPSEAKAASSRKYPMADAAPAEICDEILIDLPFMTIDIRLIRYA